MSALRFWIDCRNIGLEKASSARALIGAILGFSDLSQNGTKPHRIVATFAPPPSSLTTTGSS